MAKPIMVPISRSFDPTKPIDDPTVWYPKGMYLEDATGPDGEPIFILAEKDMAALNRYVWSCKLLPTNRDDYKLSLGIVDGSEISAPVWSAADKVIATYKGMQADGSSFLDKTWPSIVDISNDIYNFSKRAGGEDETSYYASMLRWVGDYNTEIGKSPAEQDQAKINELQESVKALTQMQIQSIEGLQAKAVSAKGNLTDYHAVSKSHQDKLNGNTDAMSNLLDGEDGEIATLTNDINECLADIGNYQQLIDAERLRIKETAYYIWIPIAGTIAGPIVAAQANANIREYEASIKKLNDTISQDREKLRTAMMLKGDITSMNKQVHQLIDSITPAIHTLELLEGAWEGMSSDLRDLHELFDVQKNQEIPPMLLEKLELQNIVEAWNTLADFADRYRQIAYLSDEPPRDTIEGFLNQLQQVQKKMK